MNRAIRILGALAMLVMLASPAHAISDQAKCDKKKATAAGKLFATAMNCYTKNFGDPSFDDVSCISAAHVKCVAAFNKADSKFGAACNATGNGGDICVQTENSAGNIYGGI